MIARFGLTLFLLACSEPVRLRTSQQQARLVIDNANAALLANRISEAVSLYQEAAELDPSFAAAHRGLGIAYARLGQGDAAIEHYRQYLQLHPSAPDAAQVKQILADYSL